MFPSTQQQKNMDHCLFLRETKAISNGFVGRVRGADEVVDDVWLDIDLVDIAVHHQGKDTPLCRARC